MAPLTPSEWALVVLGAARQPMSPVQVQKALFLLRERLLVPAGREDESYAFHAYDYGPYCGEIFGDLFTMSTNGLVTVLVPEGRSYRVYEATAAGRAKATSVSSGLDAAAREYVQNLVEWVQRQSFADLLRTVYAAFPAMAEKSVFRR